MINRVIKVFCLGAIVGISICVGFDYMRDSLSSENKTKWMVYNQGFRPVVADAAREYRKRFGGWPSRVEDLVKAGVLPSKSEIYVPIGVYSPNLVKDVYKNRAFVTNSVSGLESGFVNAPYQLFLNGQNLVIRIPSEQGIEFDDVIVNPD